MSCKSLTSEVDTGSLSSSQELEDDESSSNSTLTLDEADDIDYGTWELDDVRRHWTLLAHCEALIFPNQYPSLKFPSKLATVLWHLQRLSVRPSQHVIRDLTQCAGYTLRKITLMEKQIEKFVLCDVMLNIDWLDFASRKSFLENLAFFLSLQTGLSVVSFEKAHLKRKEGTDLLMALGYRSGKTVKRLYMWHMFNPDENPVLLDTTFCKYRDKGSFKASSTCKISFWRSLLRFRQLTTVAINYGYLADLQGHTLCMLASILTGHLEELQLLCLDADSPYPRIANDFDGRFKIPDSAWEVALQYCPKLKVHMAFIALPLYESVTAFMSQSIPLSKLYISSGIRMGKNQRELHVDCIMKTIINWYSNTLESLVIHLWHNRELLDGILLKVLDINTLLSVFEFTGILYRHDTMENICRRIRDGCYLNIKKIRIRLQYLSNPPSHFENSDRVQAKLMRDMETIAHKYKRALKERGVHMDLGTYPL